MSYVCWPELINAVSTRWTFARRIAEFSHLWIPSCALGETIIWRHDARTGFQVNYACRYRQLDEAAYGDLLLFEMSREIEGTKVRKLRYLIVVHTLLHIIPYRGSADP